MPEVDDRVLRTLIELSDAAAAHDDVAAVLELFARRAAALLAVSCCVVATADANGELGVLGASDDRARRLGRLQLADGAGPLISCFRDAAVLECRDLGSVDAWHLCAEAARPLGLGAAYALPLRRGERVLGAAVLFDAPGVLPGAAAREAAQAMATSIVVGILGARAVRHSETDSARWRATLARQIVIEQASGVLSERELIPVDEARLSLEDRAHAEGVETDELARRILRTIRVDDGSATGAPPPGDPVH